MPTLIDAYPGEVRFLARVSVSVRVKIKKVERKKNEVVLLVIFLDNKQ